MAGQKFDAKKFVNAFAPKSQGELAGRFVDQSRTNLAVRRAKALQRAVDATSKRLGVTRTQAITVLVGAAKRKKAAAARGPSSKGRTDPRNFFEKKLGGFEGLLDKGARSTLKALDPRTFPDARGKKQKVGPAIQDKVVGGVKKLFGSPFG